MHLSRNNTFNTTKYWKVYKDKWPYLIYEVALNLYLTFHRVTILHTSSQLRLNFLHSFFSTQLELNFSLDYYFAYLANAQLFTLHF